MSRAACPSCGAASLREGALKCPACKAWVAPRPLAPPGPFALAAFVALLIGVGMALGAASLWILLEPGASALPSAPPPSAPSASSATAENTIAASPPPLPEDKPGAALDVAPPSFAEARVVHVGAVPLDACFSDDEATLFVLADDGTIRVHAVESGKETARLPVPGKGSEIRLLAKRYLAVLGIAGPMPLVEIATGKITKIDLGGPATEALDLTLTEPPAIVVMSGLGRRIVRLSPEDLHLEGQVAFPRSIAGLIAGKSRGRDLLAVLTHKKSALALGTIELFDPADLPFGETRTIWPALVAPGGGTAIGASIAVADQSANQLILVSPGPTLRAAPVGQRPQWIHSLLGRYLVSIDGGATATVLSADTLEQKATLPLGAAPSSAAATPDGRALFVALGGGARDRGATTALIAGDPPAIAATFTTGPGSRSVRLAKSGRFAAVTAFFGRSVALLQAH